jgi:hypothetical protein
MKVHPLAAKFLRFLLIALGAMAVLSAVVNIMAAIELLEPSDEGAFGLGRNFVVAEYSVQALAGLAMLYFGFRKKK